jgi:hypothetical protein
LLAGHGPPHPSRKRFAAISSQPATSCKSGITNQQTASRAFLSCQSSREGVDISIMLLFLIEMDRKGAFQTVCFFFPDRYSRLVVGNLV